MNTENASYFCEAFFYFMKKTIEDLIENDYQLDLNLILLKTSTIYKKVFLPSLVFYIGAFAILFIAYFGVILSQFDNLQTASESIIALNPMTFSIEELAIYFSINALLSVLLILCNSAILHLSWQADQTANYSLGSAVKAIFSKEGIQIAIFCFVLQFTISSISYILQINGFNSVGLIVSLITHTLTLLVVPLILIGKLNMLQAIKYSVQLVNTKPLRYLWYFIFIAILSISGILFLGIGILFTLPLLYIFIYALFSFILNQKTN